MDLERTSKREGTAGNPYAESFEGSFWASLVKLIVAKDGLSKSLFELRVYSINAFYWLCRNKGGTASLRPFCDEGSFVVLIIKKLEE